MKKKYKITKNGFLKIFLVVTAALALTRLIYPSVVKVRRSSSTHESGLSDVRHSKDKNENVQFEGNMGDKSIDPAQRATSRFFTADGKEGRHKIWSVASYEESFPDSQNVQWAAASLHGVPPVRNREDAENRKRELVYIAANPYYEVRKLSSSIPYLVPRAAILLQDIGRNFFDSLQIKSIPLNKLYVTSVLRTKEDVEKLRRHNGNATENSCHLRGTTFDVAYNKYGAISRPVRDDTLKWVLCEVLNDMRKQERCYIKYEKKQGCFHITVR